MYSIFDIYFVSPIVSGMREYGVQRPAGADAPAKRLMLFVGKFALRILGNEAKDMLLTCIL